MHSTAWAEEVKEEKGIILIDPGHGGIDGGSKSKNGTVEKDINLSIALKILCVWFFTESKFKSEILLQIELKSFIFRSIS